MRIFSGIQPTGDIHLGNYLGAVKNWVSLQNDSANDCVFCVVNSHAITIRQDPAALRSQTINMAKMLIACGINPQKSTLFVQSEVDEHAALMWILDCFTPMGDMSRMTQFKDKSARHPKNINVGLFNYPALMAADILLYNTDAVPVGDDQRQHLELTRDIATRFNNEFGEVFVVPKALVGDVGARVMGLDSPESKMSKSASGTNHAVFLLDAPEVILRKFKKATTDSESGIIFEPARKGLYNLLCIYELFSGESRPAIESRFAGKGYGDFKVALAELVIEALRPIRERFNAIDDGEILSILKDGAEAAGAIASATYKRAKNAVGLI